MTTVATVNIQSISQAVIVAINNGIVAIINFVPKFIAGLIILLIGIVVASLSKKIVVELLRLLKIEVLLRKYGFPETRGEISWTMILSEIVRWFVIVLFLIPTAGVWGLTQIVTVLNAFLLYLPNVFVAAIIAMLGFVFAQLAYDVIITAMRDVNTDTSRVIAVVVKWSINIFIVLAVLDQLGIAVELVRILFTGFVAMFAIAGGIAFGLGGQDTARNLLTALKKRLK